MAPLPVSLASYRGGFPKPPLLLCQDFRKPGPILLIKSGLGPGDHVEVLHNGVKDVSQVRVVRRIFGNPFMDIGLIGRSFHLSNRFAIKFAPTPPATLRGVISTDIDNPL